MFQVTADTDKNRLYVTLQGHLEANERAEVVNAFIGAYHESLRHRNRIIRKRQRSLDMVVCRYRRRNLVYLYYDGPEPYSYDANKLFGRMDVDQGAYRLRDTFYVRRRTRSVV